MEIELREVSRTYPGGVTAVDRVSLVVPSGTTLCLLGTSGCGKTTTLKMVNRLVEPTSGTVLIGGRDARARDPIELRRSIGYVIQGGALFPHLTVEENVGLVARLCGWAPDAVRLRVRKLLELVQLDADVHVSRYPSELSGGQRQRVGVARALVVEPPVILMDEPFGAVDPLTRDDLQEQFLALKRKLAKTIVIVTHDLREAFRLADLVALMSDGRLQQIGSPEDLVARPASAFVERFIGAQAAVERPAPSAPGGRVGTAGAGPPGAPAPRVSA
jgi:osmoprotectant transport system ATP-binding protein